MRLERESDDLAQELITSKIALRAELDSAEEKADSYFKELTALNRKYKETEESRKEIQSEAAKVVFCWLFFCEHSFAYLVCR